MIASPTRLIALTFFTVGLVAGNALATSQTPVRVSLGYVGLPQPGTTFTVVCSVAVDVDTSCTVNAVLTLETGLVSGGQSIVEFDATAGAGVVAIHQYSAQALNPGFYEVSLCGLMVNDSTSAWSDCDLLNLQVSADPDSAGATSLSGETWPNGTCHAYYTAYSINVVPYPHDYVAMAPVPFDSVPNPGEPNDSLYGGPAVPLATLTVQGRYVYWLGVDGNGQPEYAPLVNATIRIWDSDSFCGDDELLGVTATNAEGRYSLAVDNGDCTGTVDVYAQALPENNQVRVLERALNGGHVQYKFNTAVHEDAGSGTLDLGTYRVEGPGYNQRACLLFDHVNVAWIAVSEVGYNTPQTLAYYGPLVDRVIDGSAFNEPNHIEIDGPAAESFDTCVHEFAHVVTYFTDDNPVGNPCGGTHYFNTPNTVGCAWQEGFADFMPVAVNDDGTYDYPGGGFETMELLPREWYEDMPLADGPRTEGAVARALYDLYDDGDDNPAGWQIGRDRYDGTFARVFDVLLDHNIATFSGFWQWWGTPRHWPVQAIRLNWINLNTSPVWSAIGNAWLYPNQVYNLDVNGRITDAQSTDNDLVLQVFSNSNPQATLSWPSPGQLRATFPPNTEGYTYITLSAFDGLVAVNSNTFQVIWSNTSPGKGYDPPEPCEYPCPVPNPDVHPVVSDLRPPQPNPFNPQTTLHYDLATADDIHLAIYDVRGQLVRTLANGFRRRGQYSVTWDGTSDDGSRMASGLYFAVFNTRSQRFTQKLVLLK